MVEHKYDGGYRVWIPRIGVRESRDVTFFEGSTPVLLDHGSAIEIQCERVQVVQTPKATLGPPTPLTINPMPTPEDIQDVGNYNNKEYSAPACAAAAEAQHSCAQPLPSSCAQIHHDADRGTYRYRAAQSSGRHKRRRAAICWLSPPFSLAPALCNMPLGWAYYSPFEAFEEPNPSFVLTPSTLDPRRGRFGMCPMCRTRTDGTQRWTLNLRICTS
jgi:hypothetical protein